MLVFQEVVEVMFKIEVLSYNRTKGFEADNGG